MTGQADVLLGPPAPVFTGISDDNGASATDRVTNDDTIVIHGTAQPLTTVTLTRSGVGVIGTTAVDGAGNWAFDYTGTALPEGLTTFSATATDSTPHTGAPSVPFIVRVDTTAPVAPTIASISPVGGLTFDGEIVGDGKKIGR